jgi:hypothetical protein
MTSLPFREPAWPLLVLLLAREREKPKNHPDEAYEDPFGHERV